MRVGISGLLISLLVMACFAISSCATQKKYHGVESTNLASLVYGMNRIDAEKITGKPEREFQCDYPGSILTYIYDRGYTGCIGDGGCKPENETKDQTVEIIFDLFSFGGVSAVINKCITPCQKGHLELFFNWEGRLIGARELPTDRDVYCWTGNNDSWEGYPCTRIYNNRQPSTVSEALLLKIPAEDIPDRICDQFTK